MPKGENPNSKKNLQKFGSEKDAREAARRANEKRAVVKPFAEYIRQQLETEVSNGKLTKEGLALVLLNQVKNGNLKAWELMLKLIGEFPQEQITVALDKIDCDDTAALLQELKDAKSRSDNDNK